ncbi:MAG: hypothetical protein PHP45_04905 [Elusimicrobiales bacterium]|nr:hypothetical protein [Elusimicrobiales bacterium]
MKKLLLILPMLLLTANAHAVTDEMAIAKATGLVKAQLKTDTRYSVAEISDKQALVDVQVKTYGFWRKPVKSYQIALSGSHAAAPSQDELKAEAIEKATARFAADIEFQTWKVEGHEMYISRVWLNQDDGARKRLTAYAVSENGVSELTPTP